MMKKFILLLLATCNLSCGLFGMDDDNASRRVVGSVLPVAPAETLFPERMLRQLSPSAQKWQHRALITSRIAAGLLSAITLLLLAKELTIGHVCFLQGQNFGRMLMLSQWGMFWVRGCSSRLNDAYKNYRIARQPRGEEPLNEPIFKSILPSIMFTSALLTAGGWYFVHRAFPRMLSWLFGGKVSAVQQKVTCGSIMGHGFMLSDYVLEACGQKTLAQRVTRNLARLREEAV